MRGELGREEGVPGWGERLAAREMRPWPSPPRGLPGPSLGEGSGAGAVEERVRVCVLGGWRGLV